MWTTLSIISWRLFTTPNLIFQFLIHVERCEGWIVWEYCQNQPLIPFRVATYWNQNTKKSCLQFLFLSKIYLFFLEICLLVQRKMSVMWEGLGTKTCFNETTYILKFTGQVWTLLRVMLEWLLNSGVNFSHFFLNPKCHINSIKSSYHVSKLIWIFHKIYGRVIIMEVFFIWGNDSITYPVFKFLKIFVAASL